MFKVVLDFDEKFINDLLASKGYLPPNSHTVNPHMANPHMVNPYMVNPHMVNPHMANPYMVNPYMVNPNPYHMANNSSNDNGNVNYSQLNESLNTDFANRVNDLENHLNSLSKNLLGLSDNLKNSNLLNEDKLVDIIDKAIEKKLSKDIITKDYLEKTLDEFKKSIDIPVVEPINLDVLKKELSSEIKEELLNSGNIVGNVTGIDIDIESLKNDILLSLSNDISTYKEGLEEEFKKKVSLLESENQKKFQELMTNYQFQLSQLQMNMMNPMLNQVNPSLNQQVTIPLENVENVVEKTEENANRTAPSKTVGRKISSMMNI